MRLLLEAAVAAAVKGGWGDREGLDRSDMWGVRLKGWCSTVGRNWDLEGLRPGEEN